MSHTESEGALDVRSMPRGSRNGARVSLSTRTTAAPTHTRTDQTWTNTPERIIRHTLLKTREWHSNLQIRSTWIKVTRISAGVCQSCLWTHDMTQQITTTSWRKTLAEQNSRWIEHTGQEQSQIWLQSCSSKRSIVSDPHSQLLSISDGNAAAFID